jgi:hypothetical protein
MSFRHAFCLLVAPASHRHSRCWSLGLLIGLWSLANGLGQSSVHANDMVLAEFSMECDGDCLVIPVVIEGNAYRFALSTCSPTTILSEHLKNIVLDEDVTASEGSGDGCVGGRVLPRLDIGELSLRNLDVTYSDLGSFGAYTGHSVDGILSIAKRHDIILQVQADEKKLRFLTSSLKVPGERLPLFRGKSGFASVHLRFGPLDRDKKDFFVDIAGPPGVALMVKSADFGDLVALDRIGQLTPDAIQIGGFDEGSGGAIGIAKRLYVGTSILSDVQCCESSSNKATLGVLLEFNATIDFCRDELILGTRKESYSRFAFDRSGIDVGLVGGEIEIVAVTEGWPGDVAGLREGDVIKAVDGTEAKSLRLFALRKLLGERERAVRLSIDRSGEAIEAIVVLSDLDE